ncbi:hypothetical protein ABIB87_004348, partial [Bradyrhizobium sp. JR18.2]
MGKAKRAHHLSETEPETVGTRGFAHPTQTENPKLCRSFRWG